MKHTYSYQIIMRPEPEGGYTVIVPALPGCITYGKTVEQAQRMAEDAIGGYLASMRASRKRVPESDRNSVIGVATVAA
jgi:predicted RNase H-like HicB family nuclease